MKDRIPQITRIVLGVILLIFGVNKFALFLPPFELQGVAGEFWTAMVNSGYVLEMVGVVEIIVGLMLVADKYVPLALLFLAPISVNIVAFHAFLDPVNIGPALLVAAANLVLMFAYKPYFNTSLVQNAVANATEEQAKVHA